MRMPALVLALWFAGHCAAEDADVDGRWTGSVSTPTGATAVTFVFHSDATALTGSYSGSDGTKSAVKDGKIEGNTLSFSLDLDFGAGPISFKYVGEISGREMEVRSEVNGNPISFTLSKAT